MICLESSVNAVHCSCVNVTKTKALILGKTSIFKLFIISQNQLFLIHRAKPKCVNISG